MTLRIKGPIFHDIFPRRDTLYRWVMLRVCCDENTAGAGDCTKCAFLLFNTQVPFGPCRDIHVFRRGIYHRSGLSHLGLGRYQHHFQTGEVRGEGKDGEDCKKERGRVSVADVHCIISTEIGIGERQLGTRGMGWHFDLYGQGDQPGALVLPRDLGHDERGKLCNVCYCVKRKV